MQLTHYSIDSNAGAVVLYEKVFLNISPPDRGLVLHEEVRRIIKILNKKGVEDLADVMRYAYHNRDHDVVFRGIQGYTYNLVNGVVVRKEMENAENTATSDLVTVKFSLPDVHEGSVIEYRYTVERDFSLLICNWPFQEDYPKLYSEVDISIPKMLNIASVSENPVPFILYNDDGRSSMDTSLPVSYKTAENVFLFGIEYHQEHWVRRNISAAHNEPFIDNYQNYTERLLLQITGIESVMMNMKIMNSWPKVNKFLYESEDFYKLLGHTKNIAEKLVTDDLQPIQKARNIYTYVRDNFQVKPSNNIFSKAKLREVFDNKGGTPAEINLLLISLLKDVGLNADPVILSKRQELKVIPHFPVFDRFNHVICRLNLIDTVLFLDASEPHIAFGALPYYCYNGYARIINKEGASVFLDPGTILDKQYTSVFAEVRDDTILFKMKTYFGAVTGMQQRDAWMKDTTLIRKSITEGLHSFSSDIHLLNCQSPTLNNPDTTLILDYTLAMVYNGETESYFNPCLVQFFKDNPFKAINRSYPISFYSPVAYSYLLQFKIPDNTDVSGLPSSQVLKLDDNDDYKHYIVYDTNTNVLQVNTRLQMKRTYFQPEEYDLLKSFWNKIIEMQQAVCLLRKKK